MPNRVSSSKVWAHFTVIPEKKIKRCNHCDKTFSQSTSTASLWTHLQKQHGISNSNKSQTESKSNENQADETENENSGAKSAINSTIRKTISKNTVQMKIPTSLKKHKKLEERIARMAAVDGFSFRRIAESEFIQDAMEMMYQKKYSSHKSIRRIVKKFAAEKRIELKQKIAENVNNNHRYSYSCDEYTSARNTRFMNVNLHGKNGEFFNLGMVHVPKSLKSEKAKELVEKRTLEFGLGKHLNSQSS